MNRETILAMTPSFHDRQDFDTLVAERVMGWTRVHPAGRRGKLYGFRPGEKHVCVVPLYWFGMDEAWTIVQRLRERGMYVDVITYPLFYQVRVHDGSGRRLATVSLRPLPEAIAKAALIAVLDPDQATEAIAG